MNTSIKQTDPLIRPLRHSWLMDHAANTKSLIINKFLDGERDHQGDIGELTSGQLLTEMRAEALDLLNYLAEFHRRMNHPNLIVVNRDDLGLLYRELNNIAPQSQHFCRQLTDAMCRVAQLLRQTQ